MAELLQLTEVEVAEAVENSASTVEETGVPLPELSCALECRICRGRGSNGGPSMVNWKKMEGYNLNINAQ